MSQSETPCGRIYQIPGPAGANGTNGTNGTNGRDAFSITTAPFTMPAIANPVTVALNQTAWMVPGAMWCYVQGAGGFLVFSVPGATSAVLVNAGWPGNAIAGTVVATNARCTASGPQGPTGATGAPGAGGTVLPNGATGTIWVEGAGAPPDPNAFPIGAANTVLHTKLANPLKVGWNALDLTGAATALSGALPIANGGTGKGTQQLAINALCNSAGSATGDLLYFDSTNWIRLPRGTPLQVLQTNALGTSIQWASSSNSLMAFRVSNSIDKTYTGATVGPIDLDTETSPNFDPDNVFDNTNPNFCFTAPVSGYYQFHLTTAVTTTGASATLELTKGVTSLQVINFGVVTNQAVDRVFDPVQLAAGDKISVYTTVPGGSTIKVFCATLAFSGFKIR